MLAASTFDVTIGGVAIVLVLIIAAVFLARKDRVTRVKLGIFFEREREREDEWPDPSAKTEILWRHPSDAPTTIPDKED